MAVTVRETRQFIKTRSRRIFMEDMFCAVVLLFSVVLFIFPFINLAATSFSSARAVMSGEVKLLPIEFQLDTWREVFGKSDLLRSMIFSILLTAVYTVTGLILIIMAAYPLSRRDFKGKLFFTGFFLFTMYFSGGMIPTYLLLHSLKMLDTFYVLVLPGVFSVYNMLILRTFFINTPLSLEESARIDGADDFTILFKIYLPLSLPALASLALFFAVSRWNGFTDAVFYLPTRRNLTPIQLTLQRILAVVRDVERTMRRSDGSAERMRLVKESLKAATILFTDIPIIAVYPWLQKYFVKGVMIGAIKE